MPLFSMKDEVTVVVKDERPEQALVIVGAHEGPFFVVGRGPIIESDVEAGMPADECGPVCCAPEEKGLWVWEGRPGWRQDRTPEGIDEGGEPIYHDRGTWRRPWPNEIRLLQAGDLDAIFGPPRLERGEPGEETTP